MSARLFPTPKGDTPWVLRQAIARLIAAYNALQNDVGVLQNAIVIVRLTVGEDGDDWVFKNGAGWLLFDDGLYRRNVGAMVEGQPQGSYEVTGYTYANIP